MLQAVNPFDTVLEEIKKMIAIIEEEEEADVKQKEWCESERAENHENKESTEREIDGLEETINTLENDITGLIESIAETEKSLKENHASQTEETATRSEENRAYQTNIKNIVSVQEEPDPGDTWEGDYKGQSEQGGEVISTLEFIKEESWKEEKETHKTEEEAQHDFEDSMK